MNLNYLRPTKSTKVFEAYCLIEDDVSRCGALNCDEVASDIAKRYMIKKPSPQDIKNILVTRGSGNSIVAITKQIMGYYRDELLRQADEIKDLLGGL